MKSISSNNQINVPDCVPVSPLQMAHFVSQGLASLAVFLMVIWGRILELLRIGRKEPGKVIIPLPEEKFLRFTTSTEKYCLDEVKTKTINLTWTIREVELVSGIAPGIDKYGQSGHLRIHFNGNPTSHIHGIRSTMTADAEIRYYAEDLKQLQEKFRDAFPDPLAFVRYLCPKLDFAAIRRYCGMPDRLFASFSIPGGTLHQVVFDDPTQDRISEYKMREPGHVEEYYLHHAIRKIASGSTCDTFPLAAYVHSYPNHLQLLFPFRNKYGETMMYAALLYNLSTGRKTYIPITTFIGCGTGEKHLFAIPCQKKQPIYNADLIAKAEEPPVVVIADNVEVAELNQKNAPRGVIFTAWLCDDGHLEEVDLTPLLKAGELVVLVVNHSGKRLEEAYIEAAGRFKELRLQKGFETMPISFYQAEVDYPVYRIPYGMDDFLSSRNEAMGSVVEDSMFFLSEAGFQAMLEKAKKSLDAPKPRFWKGDDTPVETAAPKMTGKLRHQVLKFIIHPHILFGEVTGIYAKKNTGKTPVAYTIGISATAYREKGSGSLFPEKSIIANRHPHYANHKVVYLDFENGKSEIESKIASIGSVYWPSREKFPENYRKSQENFIVVDMQKSDHYGTDFSRPENHQIVLNMVEEAKSQGTVGQPVDMLVIDTYNKFVGTESIATNAGFSKLTRTLRNMGIAVLVLGQLGDNESVRGFKQKLDDEYCTIILYREDDSSAHSLETTPLYLKVKNYRGKLTDEQLAEFSFTYPFGKKLQLANANSTSSQLEDASLLGYLRQYKKLGYEHSQIASMLGLADKSLYDREAKIKNKK